MKFTYVTCFVVCQSVRRLILFMATMEVLIVIIEMTFGKLSFVESVVVTQVCLYVNLLCVLSFVLRC